MGGYPPFCRESFRSVLFISPFIMSRISPGLSKSEIKAALVFNPIPHMRTLCWFMKSDPSIPSNTRFLDDVERVCDCFIYQFEYQCDFPRYV